MGDIKDFVEIYINEESDILEDYVKEIWQSMRFNWDKLLYEGHGRRTGTLLNDLLHNTMYNINGNVGIVEGSYTVEYGKYVDNADHEYHRFEGYQFMQEALEMILQEYGG